MPSFSLPQCLCGLWRQGLFLCLGLAAANAQAPGSGPCPSPSRDSFTVEFYESGYRAAAPGGSGFFRAGQPPDLMLSGIDFNRTGGPLLFNHNGGIASDGVRLLLADRNNNRVLIWNRLPDGNVPPDLVLGQPDFLSNEPGRGRHQLNWPVSVATDGRRVVVADAYNDRLLVWNIFPAASGAPADLEIRVVWPWGVWTDGRRLVATATGGGAAFIWTDFPTRDDQPADIRLRAGGSMGTPRTITSNARSLIIGDHNSRVTAAGQGNFVWKSFPTVEDAPYDYFLTDPLDERYAWLQGDFLPDGRLFLLGRTLHFWSGIPENPSQRPELSIAGFSFNGGDGSAAVAAGGRIYISEANGNKVLVYRSIPARADQPPDFAIGSLDICVNTLDANFFITNPMPSSNGSSLLVSSDFDRKLYVWKRLPGESGAPPDLVYTFPAGAGPWQSALWKDWFAAAGPRGVFVWRSLPLDGRLPDLTFNAGIGSVRFQELRGVALDDRYFYLSDQQANRVYVWQGLPAAGAEPAYALNVERPGRLSSDGTYLAVVRTENHAVELYRIAGLPNGERPVTIGGPGRFNLPEHALVARGHLFVADTPFNRVHCWRRVEDALAGRDADVLLGSSDRRPSLGPDGLFWPGGLSFDGSYLWVGEFKFSGRLLRFAAITDGEPPRINEGGVVNAASFQGALAGGSIVSMFGRALATGAAAGERLPLPVSLLGTWVRVNGIPAPLLYVSPAQINFQMPWQLLASGTASASVTVITPYGASPPQTIAISGEAPAIFTVNPGGQGAILVAGASQLAAPAGSIPNRNSRPARRGETVSIFCTGLGAVSNQPQNGESASPAVPSQVNRPVRVRIGSVLVDADFAGLAPGFVSLYQVNVRVPESAPAGAAVPVQLVAGSSSNTVTMAVE